MSGQPFQPKSHWMTTRGYTPGPSLEGDVQVDVAIVGGGFTGLSTAYHLKKEEPGMRSTNLLAGRIGKESRMPGISYTTTASLPTTGLSWGDVIFP